MDTDLITDSLVGWSVGYTYAEAKDKENEIKQGKNYYLASFCQVAQVARVGMVISKINQAVPEYPFKRAVNVFCNIGPLLSYPVFLYCASVKHGDNEKVAKWFNGSRFAYIKLPEKLGTRSVSFMRFIAEHSGDMCRVAMIAGSIALIALGNTVYGTVVLTALSYQVLDHNGYVPRRISLFMEMYMPTISLVGLCVGGTLIVRAFSAIALSGRILPSFNVYLHHRVDAVARYFFDLKGPNLEEIDAPYKKREQMSYNEINQILEASSYDFEINPSHCSHPLVELDKLPKDTAFDKLITLFDQVDWEKRFALILGKLKDDDRFIDELSGKFPTIAKEDLPDSAESCVEELAQLEGISKEEFAVNYVHSQLEELVKMLKGEKRVTGLQQDLDESISDCAILLPYISSMDDPIEQEDALLKLAVEGGDYCGRGIKRAVNELMRGILEKGVDDPAGIMDPTSGYEMGVMQALQNTRHTLILAIYQLIAKQLNIPNQISQDTHGFDIYRLYFSLGFYPLTAHERRRLGLNEIGLWELYDTHRSGLYNAYKASLDDTVKSLGEVNFGVYLQQIIQDNDQLSDQQKDDLLEMFTERNDDTWSLEETHERFHRLMFVRLGVLRHV